MKLLFVKRLSWSALLLLLCLNLSAQAKVNLDSLYDVLDAALDSADIFKQQKNERIESLKRQLQTAITDSDRYNIASKVLAEYVPYVNDSAIAYHYRCIDLAEKMGREDLKFKSEAGLAYQLANSGFYNEARFHFEGIPEKYLTGELLNTYLSGLNHLYGEMGFYSHDPELKKEFSGRANEIRQQLLEKLDSTSSSWLALRTMILNNKNKPLEALPYCDRWMKICTPGSRKYAIMAFYRSEIYKKLDDVEMQRYWLVQSALVDIRGAIMDQGSLWSLANSLIRDERDVDRANRYVDFSWKCLSQFSTHMRSWLVAPVLARINDEYKQQLKEANNNLRWTVGLISLLTVGLLLLLFYVTKKRQQLATARNELKAANEELASLNRQLSDKVILLNDSNRVKDEYIGKFLSICSEYIDKLDNYRIKVNRKLKANQYADLMRMTGSEQLKEDELKELYYNFDVVFLHLFPSFVEDFNALLRPEERIEPAGKDLLNTDLRIFALIRLGIDESSKIAEFLHYSPNSIYAYRARIKNKAAGSRDEFEKRVKEIGLV